MPTPFCICVVCSGNICRSPMGAVVLRRMFAEAGLGDDVEVTSAGIGDWHIGEGADRRALAALTRAGYDGTAHRARLFEPSWYDAHDLILVSDRGHLRDVRAMTPDGSDTEGKVRFLREFDPESTTADLDLADPYYGDNAGFDTCLTQVVAASRGVVTHVGEVVRGH